MDTKRKQSLRPLKGGQGKNTNFLAQLEVVCQAFKERPMTMLEADVHTGIMRSNICWYIDELAENNRIGITRKRKCSITGRLVNEYTANPQLFPKSNQLNLFGQANSGKEEGNE